MRWILSREPVRLGNFEFITDYFGGLSLSPRRGNEGAIFVGLTHSGAEKEASLCQVGKEPSATLPLDGTTQRPRLPPL
jgi:hypothetical protein